MEFSRDAVTGDNAKDVQFMVRSFLMYNFSQVQKKKKIIFLVEDRFSR